MWYKTTGNWRVCCASMGFLGSRVRPHFSLGIPFAHDFSRCHTWWCNNGHIFIPRSFVYFHSTFRCHRRGVFPGSQRPVHIDPFLCTDIKQVMLASPIFLYFGFPGAGGKENSDTAFLSVCCEILATTHELRYSWVASFADYESSILLKLTVLHALRWSGKHVFRRFLRGWIWWTTTAHTTTIKWCPRKEFFYFFCCYYFPSNIWESHFMFLYVYCWIEGIHTSVILN